MIAPSGTDFKAFSGVEGFVKVSNINGHFRLAENLDIQCRTSKSIIRDAPLNAQELSGKQLRSLVTALYKGMPIAQQSVCMLNVFAYSMKMRSVSLEGN
ncbi:MAG: hypothetical protein OXE99_07415 [Cellvibrionales bacterium]|nr:hypothetical protein [Cellvibrionales bacterium]